MKNKDLHHRQMYFDNVEMYFFFLRSLFKDETLQKRNSDHPKDLMQGGGISELKHDEEAIMIHPRNQPIALPSSLNSSRLGNTGAAYVANFLSTEEEQKLMREVEFLFFSFHEKPTIQKQHNRFILALLNGFNSAQDDFKTGEEL